MLYTYDDTLDKEIEKIRQEEIEYKEKIGSYEYEEEEE
jgi:hypothetical protein